MSNIDTLSPNRFQEQFGQPSERARTKIRDYMEPAIQEFIRQAPFAVLATQYGPRQWLRPRRRQKRTGTPQYGLASPPTRRQR
jgi:predicted pyridoxine 5'-phosphate oxidase superfamily flavin-nucleotide-binding protein